MDHIKNNKEQPVDRNKEILFWPSYVGDCFCILNTDAEGAEFLLQKINHIDPRLSLRWKPKKTKNSTFLTTIFNNNNTLEFSIFRKPTQTDHALPDDSNHHPQHKMAVFRCYVNRLLRTPLSEENHRRELNTTKQIALNNGYDPECIDKLIKKFRRDEITNLAYARVPHSHESPVFVIPFVSVSLNRYVSRIVRQLVPETRIVHKNNSSLKSLLVNSKDKKPRIPDSPNPHPGQG